MLGPKAGPRFAALDGLRGLAAMLVVLYHMNWSNHLTGTIFVRNGYLAVDLFFILSGFIIFANYAQNIVNFEQLHRFICLRFFRVYPLHFAILVFLIGMELIKAAAQRMGHVSELQAFAGETSVAALGANLLLVHGLHTIGGLSWNLPSWSISCEFAVYFVFGLSALAGALSMRLFVFLITPICIALYAVLAVSLGTLDTSYDWGVARAIGGFFLAPLLMLAGRGLGAPSTGQSLAEITVVGGGIAIMSVTTGSMVVLVIPMLFLAVCLLQTDQGPVSKILHSPTIQYLGRISYSVYMVQFVVLLAATIVLKRFFKLQSLSAMNPWIGDLLVLGVACLVVGAATLTFHFIEEPGRVWGRKLVSRRMKFQEGLDSAVKNRGPVKESLIPPG